MDNDLVITLIVLIVISLFLIYALYLVSISNATTPESPISSDHRAITYSLCPVGECATNLLNGYKRCPSPNDEMSYNPQLEVCNPPTSCTNFLTPYALQSDGSTSINGLCEPGVTCPCFNYITCPYFVTSLFTYNNGNPYTSLDGQRITFPQVLPLKYTDPAQYFCFAPVNWLAYSSPGCNFISDPDNITLDQIAFCMGGSSGCSGYNANPCAQGTLALISANGEISTDVESGNFTGQLACVQGLPCPCGQITAYNLQSNSIFCVSV